MQAGNVAPALAEQGLSYAQKLAAERKARMARLGAGQVVPMVARLQIDKTKYLSGVWLLGPPQIPTHDDTTIRDVIRAVAHFYKIPIARLLSGQRQGSIVHARHVAFYICRTDLTKTLSQIGQAFNKDHTTIMHGAEILARRLERQPSLREEVNQIRMLCGTISKLGANDIPELPPKGNWRKWTAEEDKRLLDLIAEGRSLVEIAPLMGRTERSIWNRWRVVEKKAP